MHNFWGIITWNSVSRSRDVILLSISLRMARRQYALALSSVSHMLPRQRFGILAWLSAKEQEKNYWNGLQKVC